MIPSNIIEEIRSQADIVQIISSYINVTKKGNSYVAVCPFHADKNPSLMISQQKQIYKCFSCNAGGNVFTFVQNYEKISFIEAVRKVAAMINFTDPSLVEENKRVVSPKEKTNFDVLKYAALIYHDALETSDGQHAKAYLLKRDITEEMVDYFLLGYSYSNKELSIKLLRQKGASVASLEETGILLRDQSGNFIDRFSDRLIFPIFNEYDQVVGFSGRIITNVDLAKYVNSPSTPQFNKSRVLYNYQNAKKSAKQENAVYVVEGFMDVFALYKAGIKSAVAVMGTAFTPYHAKMLRRLGVEIRLALDGDNAGQKGQILAIEVLNKEGLTCKVVDYQGLLLDPDEILKTQGQEGLLKVLNRLEDQYEFLFKHFKKNIDISTIGGKKEYITSFLPFINDVRDQIEKEAIIQRLMSETNLPRKSFEHLLKKADDQLIDELFIPQGKARKESKVLKAQKEILYQMIKNPDAVNDFTRTQSFFIESLYNEISNYIIDLYRDNKAYTIHELIGTIEEKSMNPTPLVEEVTRLSLEEGHTPYSSEAVEEVLETLKKEIEKQANLKKIKKAMLETDEISKAKAIDELRKTERK